MSAKLWRHGKLFDADQDALIAVCGDFNAGLNEVPVQAIRGDIEKTGNDTLSKRVMALCERTIPESARFSLIHHGKSEMVRCIRQRCMSSRR